MQESASQSDRRLCAAAVPLQYAFLLNFILVFVLLFAVYLLLAGSVVLYLIVRVLTLFPRFSLFSAEFFRTAPRQPLFVGDFAADMRTAEGCMKHLRGVFEALEDCRTFEILKNGADRANFLLARQVRLLFLLLPLFFLLLFFVLRYSFPD